MAGSRRRFSQAGGGQHIDEVILVDQSPIGRHAAFESGATSRCHDAITRTFANTREARPTDSILALFIQRARRRGEVCQGDGTVTVEMQFLADVELVCENARTRSATVLDVRYRGKNIHDVLNMTIRERSRSSGHNEDRKQAARVDEVGWVICALGQSADDFVGGVVKPRESNWPRTWPNAPGARTLYIFDDQPRGCTLTTSQTPRRVPRVD